MTRCSGLSSSAPKQCKIAIIDPTETPMKGWSFVILLEAYLNVQTDPRFTTVLHIDNTHSTVNTRYPVFVLGISDPSGRYFPIVYYCSSQPNADDIKWILAFLKRVFQERYAYVMTDADDAQFNASSTDLPTTTSLMCWFHVSQNIKDKTQHLPRVTRTMIFRDFNRLHFCSSRENYIIQKDRVLAAWESAYSFTAQFKKVGQYLVAQWIQVLHRETQIGEESRFSKWQIFHTPPGYATTNHPLEQYHRTLKIVHDSDRATPIELMQRLDRSRCAFVAKNIAFNSVAHVSARLRALYNRMDRLRAISAEVIPRVVTLRLPNF
ncbi:Hypothetical protein PHPALM_3779 [Phytophthora palmivora]|uniref:MULE transposase domain-containing protein n=1 Tax=Phytophthora palmivora TaxID=4796 RepID=A0A2P4YLI3_9STRA|nr:Hypothetical protein PHPALM_3779 [Phytophthora palmivora]